MPVGGRAREVVASWSAARRRRARLERLRSYRGTGRGARSAELWKLAGCMAQQPLPTRDDLAVRQVVLDALMFRGLLAELRRARFSGAPGRIPAPRAWRDALRSIGVPVAEARSRLGWCRLLLGGAWRGLRTVARLATRRPGDVPVPAGPWTVVLGLPPDARPVAGRSSRDVVSWLRRAGEVEGALWVVAPCEPAARAADLDVVAHPYPAVGGLRRLAWVGRVALDVARAVLDPLSLMVLDARIEASYVATLPRRQLPRRVVTHAGSAPIRPLWTVVAEERGTDVVNLHYSANSEPFSEAGWPADHPFPGYLLLRWPRSLVWDDRHADLIRSFGAGAVEVVGPIDFADGGVAVPQMPEPVVAVFDVPAQATAEVVGRGETTSSYYRAAVVTGFLQDAVEAITRAGAVPAVKAKREIGALGSVAYRHCLAELADDDRSVLVDPGIPASRLIERSAAVVSLPFTSTAILARAAGVPSAYFDPTGRMSGRSPIARRLPLLTSRPQLDTWLARVLGRTTEAPPPARLVLGTAQLGMAYGVTNEAGQPDEAAARALLERARARGLRAVDTAASYGESEDVLGRVLPTDMAVLTKTVPLGAEGAGGVVAGFERSLRRLERPSVDALLVHQGHDLLGAEGPALLDALLHLRRRGLTRRLGVSVYDLDELDALLDRFTPDVVQLPLNLWDQRFLASGLLIELHERCIEVHARSVLLQGVLVTDPDALPPSMGRAEEPLRWLRARALEMGASPLRLALGFALQHAGVDAVVVGAARAGELDEIVDAALAPIEGEVDWAAFAVEDRALTDPRQW